MTRYMDIKNWNRKNQFYFFKDYDIPFFNICADLDITALYSFVKDHHISFFQASLYLSLKAANEIREFRYRLREDQVVIHDVIHAGSTVLNKDETFSFCYFDYFPDFGPFEINASKVLKENAEKEDVLEAHEHRDDMIHYSMIPWISFTSFSHARRLNPQDSVPKIVFGKFTDADDLKKMPVSVEVHHALMDGIHVAKYFDLFQEYVLTPEKILKR